LRLVAILIGELHDKGRNLPAGGDARDRLDLNLLVHLFDDVFDWQPAPLARIEAEGIDNRGQNRAAADGLRTWS